MIDLYYLFLAFVIIYITVNYKEIKDDFLFKKIYEQKNRYYNFLDDWIRNHNYSNNNNKSSRYPYDWLIRRQFILLRDNFICSFCGEKLYSVFINSNNWYKNFFDDQNNPKKYLFAGYRCHNAHIHHIKRISIGGGHNVNNLQLLCSKCHSEQDGHVFLKTNILKKKYLKIYSKKSKSTKARVIHNCEICKKLIDINENYYKGSNLLRYGYVEKTEICFNCFNKYILN